MTQAAATLLDAFDALAEDERQEVAAEILRRSLGEDPGELRESELVGAATVVFQLLDEAEEQQ
ncbi:MAG TPA: hypothetical protein PK413_09960 [Thermoanaerobaculia bacterium]|nr:hypothetical protein [Thermoanaerobaculia bacterium]